MKHSLALAALLLLTGGLLQGSERHQWVVTSPTHQQTFAYGSEKHQAWITRDRHLALAAEFTNDPYVDQFEPRRYDDFTFDFPNVTLGKDGRTFYYRTPGGREVAVAVRHSGFLGLEEIDLLGNSFLVMKKPHGYLTLALVVLDGSPNERAEASL